MQVIIPIQCKFCGEKMYKIRGSKKLYKCNNCLAVLDINELFTEDGKPKCLYCGKVMKNYVPTKGRFKGQVQKYSWVCDCNEFPKNVVINIG
jgi:NAD-dependent SIR2 family protein deacetylase